ncbi:hypothetical protein BHE74_00058899, partial [Ensete ventricosum]
CYPGEDDMAIARAVMLGKTRTARYILVRQLTGMRTGRYRALLDEIAEKFYGIRRSGLPDIFGDLLKVSIAISG